MPDLRYKMGSRYWGKRRVGSGDEVKLMVDLGPVIEFLAAGNAMALSLNQTKKYTDSIFDNAFGEADEEFNIRAAGYAAVTGNISHMYEWGTIGINRGRTNMRPDPMSRAARLWDNVAPGRGFNRVITYYFKPSFANVPKPTVRDTGMDPEIIGKMRDHIFRWKAEMMEWGREVTIVPDKAKFLLIPVTEANRAYVRSNDAKRGYTLSKGPITFQAGGNRYANNFTTFWMQYWEGDGEFIVNRAVNRQIIMDFQPEMTKKQLRAMKMLPAGPAQNIESRIAAYTKKVERKVEALAKARSAKYHRG